ncbi:hypothetical protein F8S13_19465 [Chloroflexia bacterium SDU3-3]|nr:hypothetical protein F8S13_19465 [Chloroflexia bacterium SDU3-3]
MRSTVPLVARLFLKCPALYLALHRYMRESVGLGPLAYEFESRGYTVALAPLEGGLATALVVMKQGVEE